MLTSESMLDTHTSGQASGAPPLLRCGASAIQTTTAPAGLTITWTGAPQTNAGTYQLTATVNDKNYQGSASGSFVINKAAATVMLGNLTQTRTGTPLTPTATTTPAGLNMTWTGAPQINA